MRYCIICGKEHQSTTDHFKTDHSFLIRNKKFNKDDDKKWYTKTKLNVKALKELNFDWRIDLTNEIIYKRKSEICSKANDIKVQVYKQVITKAKEYKFQWSNIHFEEGHIVFEDSKTNMRFSKIKCAKSREVLNQIREAFYNEKFKNRLCKFYANGNNIKLEESNDIKEILASIDLLVELYNRKNPQKKLLQKHPIPRHNSPKNFPINNPIVYCTDRKMKYFQYLYENRNIERQIIPLKEYINGSLEDAILFFIRTSYKNEYAIWENVNPGRATYFFKIENEVILNNIKNYIQLDSRSKRSALKAIVNHKKAKEYYGFRKSFNHNEDFEIFKSEINNLKYT